MRSLSCGSEFVGEAVVIRSRQTLDQWSSDFSPGYLFHSVDFLRQENISCILYFHWVHLFCVKWQHTGVLLEAMLWLIGLDILCLKIWALPLKQQLLICLKLCSKSSIMHSYARRTPAVFRDVKIRAYISLNSDEIGVKEIDVREYQYYCMFTLNARVMLASKILL